MSDMLDTFDNIAGIKIGSKWTVGYGKPFGEKPVIELTVVRKQEADPIKKEYIYRFSRAIQDFDDAIFPLLHGAPRRDKECPLSRSCHLLKEFGTWFVTEIPETPIPEDSGIMFCLPMIRNKEGIKALKSTLRQLPIGKIGMEFLGEAVAAAYGTLPISKILENMVLSLNFGSSTLEAALFIGTRPISDSVWLGEFGGSFVDRMLIGAIEQTYRGLTATENQSRKIKEQYSLKDNKDVFARLTRKGSLSERYIEGNLIKQEMMDYINRVAVKIAESFLPRAKGRNPAAINALQVEGKGYLAIVGGMANMPGFSEAMHEALIERGGISPDIEVVTPSDGVVAPAIGAWKMANLLEKYRREQNVDTWDEIKKK